MKIKQSVLPLSFLFLLVIPSCSSVASSSSSVRNNLISVSVREGEHFRVTSQNPIDIGKNENATFTIAIDDHYHFDSVSKGTFENSILTVSGISLPTILDFSVVHDGSVAVHVHNDDSLGEVKASDGREFYELGESITLTCTPKGSNVFVGWSLGTYTNQNLTSKSGQTICFSPTFSFSVNSEMDIFANYHLPNATLFQYHGNGGSLKNSSVDAFFADSVVTFQSRQRPNTLQGSKHLFRDGYTLDSWNTRPDGSGTRIGLGSKADYAMMAGKEIDLYAIWDKWTEDSDFSFIANGNTGFAISAFLGPKETSEIVIPAIHNGLPVTKIEANSFVDCSFQSLVLSNSLRTVEENAFASCVFQKSLTVFSSTSEIYPASFSSPLLKTIYINADTFGTDTDSFCDMTLDYDLAVTASKDKPTLFIVGMSTIMWNNPASILNEAFGDKYNIVKLGAHWGASWCTLIDVLNACFEAGDKAVIVLHSSVGTMFESSLLTFSYLDFNFDLISSFDYQVYQRTFFGKPWIDWHGAQISDLVTPIYSYDSKSQYDIYGGKEWASQKVTDPNNRGADDISVSDSWISGSPVLWIDNELDNKIKRSDVALSPSTYNENAVSEVTRERLISSYANILSKMPLYSHFEGVEDNILPGIQFRYQDNTHLSVDGGTKKMQRWTEQLKNFL